MAKFAETSGIFLGDVGRRLLEIREVDREWRPVTGFRYRPRCELSTAPKLRR